jgi:riboflavin transporter 2
MTVTVQLANIGPILYFVGRTLCKGKGVEVQTWAIYIMYLLGIASCSLLAGLWNRTSDVLGEQHSTALISLLFFLALLDCTSTVTFIPFMAQFPKHYLSALYIGEGLSGFLPSIIALVQTVGIDTNSASSNQQSPYQNCSLNVTSTRFSVNAYFGTVTCLILASAVGFLLLNVLPIIKKLKTTTSSDSQTQGLLQEKSAHHPHTVTGKQPTFWSRKLMLLLTLEVWLNGMSNGVIPAVSSYAYTPYGPTASVIIVNVGMLAGPLTAFACLKFNWKDAIGRPAVITTVVVVAIHTALSGYIVWLASPMCSSNHPLQGETTGTILMVSNKS